MSESAPDPAVRGRPAPPAKRERRGRRDSRRARLRRVITWRRLLLALAVVVLVAVAVAVTVAPVRARAKAVPVLAETLGLPVVRPFAAEVTRSETTMGGVLGDLYHPGRPAPPVLLVPGATPAGREEPRMIAVVESLTAAGRMVFVPELTLYEQRFDEDDLDRIVEAAAALVRHTDARGPLAMVGFSYGGSFGMVAAADDRLAADVALVATFGAYFDMVDVIRSATTGYSIFDSRYRPWPERDPMAEEVIVDVAVDEAPPGQQRRLRRALEGDLAPERLPDEARAIHALVTNDDPDRTDELVAALPREMQRRLRRFSPAAVHRRIAAPVVAMHSTDDPAVPYAEGLRLSAAMPDATFFRVDLFRHVEFGVDDLDRALTLPRDILAVWRFTGRLLAAQE